MCQLALLPRKVQLSRLQELRLLLSLVISSQVFLYSLSVASPAMLLQVALPLSVLFPLDFLTHGGDLCERN